MLNLGEVGSAMSVVQIFWSYSNKEVSKIAHAFTQKDPDWSFSCEETRELRALMECNIGIVLAGPLEVLRTGKYFVPSFLLEYAVLQEVVGLRQTNLNAKCVLKYRSKQI